MIEAVDTRLVLCVISPPLFAFYQFVDKSLGAVCSILRYCRRPAGASAFFWPSSQLSSRLLQL